MVSSAPRTSESQKRRGSDPISWYLSTIGRIPLLTPAEEIELGNQVQMMMNLTEEESIDSETKKFTSHQRRLMKKECQYFHPIAPLGF